MWKERTKIRKRLSDWADMISGKRRNTKIDCSDPRISTCVWASNVLHTELCVCVVAWNIFFVSCCGPSFFILLFFVLSFFRALSLSHSLFIRILVWADSVCVRRAFFSQSQHKLIHIHNSYSWRRMRERFCLLIVSIWIWNSTRTSIKTIRIAECWMKRTKKNNCSRYKQMHQYKCAVVLAHTHKHKHAWKYSKSLWTLQYRFVANHFDIDRRCRHFSECDLF